ncbi:hypothetical protein EMCRGX_G015486 [Ephydatia muelleri]
MKTNPVTDGKAKFKPAPDQAVISPTGSMVTHWFRKVLGNPDLGSVYFMGSRNGMGTSWFMQTNALKYVNSFTFSFQVALAPNLLILQKQTKYVKERHICKDLNVIGYANLRKAEIICLILNYVADPSYGGKPINIGETLIKAQHLTPFSKGHKQENTLMGTLNESNVVDHLKQFVELHCENACGLKLTVLDNKEYGLVGYKDEGIVPKAQITSIDQVFRVKDTTNLASTTFFVGCEIKTKTTCDTEQTELEYIKTTLQNEVYGHISFCSEADAEVFKKQIPQRSHRAQRMIHGLNVLMDKSSCSSYEAYKKHLNNSFGSFRMFCIQLVDVIESSLGIPEITGVGVDHLLSVVQEVEVEVEVNTAHDSPKTHHAILANS